MCLMIYFFLPYIRKAILLARNAICAYDVFKTVLRHLCSAFRLYDIVKCIYSCIEFLKQSFKVKPLACPLFLFLLAV